MHNPLQSTRALYEAMHRVDGPTAAQLGIHRIDLRCLNALELGPLTPGQLGERRALTSGSSSTFGRAAASRMEVISEGVGSLAEVFDLATHAVAIDA